MNILFLLKPILKSPILWAILVVGTSLLYFTGNLRVEKSTGIEETAIDITSVKEIAQWEFLTIQREEFVSKDENTKKLACIYNGTIRLGLDMRHAKKDWAKCHQDTALLELPSIEILDRDFIDETATRTFHSEGNVTSLRDPLYYDAKELMRRNALTAENITTAEQMAKDQFTRLFKSLGFRHVEITLEECIE